MTKSDHLKCFGDRMFETPYDNRDEHAMTLMKRGRNGLNTWDGRVIMHDPIFMNSLRLLMHEIKPATILEFGTYEGGLTAYMSDLSRVMNLNANIVSYDVDLLSNKLSEPINNVELVHLDVFHIWKYVTDQHEFLMSLAHPLIVIDDVGQNTLEILRAMDVYLESGDYFISCHTGDAENFSEIAQWAEGRYMIDGYLCDLFGRNFIENPNGFLIKN